MYLCEDTATSSTTAEYHHIENCVPNSISFWNMSLELDIIDILDCSVSYSDILYLPTDLQSTLKVKMEGEQKYPLLRDYISHMFAVSPLTIHSGLQV
jgi:hypothetical protein